MRALLAAALTLAPLIALADEPKKLIAISIEPLGDSKQGVVTEISFRFANPKAITYAGLFLEGSLSESGHAPRDFRFAVPRKDDKLVGTNTYLRNGKIVSQTRWAVLPDQRNEMTMIHTFALGTAEVEARLVLEGDFGKPAVVSAQTIQTFTIESVGHPYVAPEAEEQVAKPALPEEASSVKLTLARHREGTNLFAFSVDAVDTVKRVEFWMGPKRILTRNVAPYGAELDAGDLSDVIVRAIGFDASGKYVDADAFFVDDNTEKLRVALTRSTTADGIAHFKLTVRNPRGVKLKGAALYAGADKLHEWDRGPFTFDIAKAQLSSGEIRAVVIDEDGQEVSDRIPAP